MKPTPILTRPSFSPNYDNKIFKKYSIKTLESKVINKLAFQQELGFVGEKKIPLLCISGGMSETQGGEIFEQVIAGLLSLNCQIIVLGKGSQKYGSMLTQLEEENAHRIKIIKDNEDNRRKMYASADISLFFTEDVDELANCLAYGTIPVSTEQDCLKDFDPAQEAGNAFIAESSDPWAWFAALVRACETFKLPYDWKTIQKQAMEMVKGE